MNDELAIATHGLRKRYGRKLAVADLTLEVRRGEAFGLLGPNGAGKSTCVKMLLGLARPSAGQGWLLGCPLGKAEPRRRVGFLPEHFHFQDWLSGGEMLRLHGRLLGMETITLRRRIAELLERVGLERQGNKPIREYSKGMQQRVGLAQALLNDPEIVFLDEPTSGLDPLGRILVRDLIREQKRRGTAVFVNSHLLSEVEASCDRVGFMKEGRIVAVRELGAAQGTVTVRVRARRWPDGIRERFGIEARPTGDALWQFEVERGELLPEILDGLVRSGAEVSEFTPVRGSLEEVFVRVVGADGGEG